MRELMAAMALAAVLAGETPGCPVEAKIAAAHVASRNEVWFARATPGAVDLAVALVWEALPDPTAGAGYFIGPGDAARMGWLEQRTGRWECAGTWVESWVSAARGGEA